MQIKKLFIALGIVLPLHMQGQNFLIKDAPEVIESYVNQFNREDNELYKQDIPNCGASDFFKKEYSIFCSVRIRSWRKHIIFDGGLIESI